MSHQRRFQFRLRSLMVFMLCAGIGLGMVVNLIQWVFQEAIAVAAIRSEGGSVEFSGKSKSDVCAVHLPAESLERMIPSLAKLSNMKRLTIEFNPEDAAQFQWQALETLDDDVSIFVRSETDGWQALVGPARRTLVTRLIACMSPTTPDCAELLAGLRDMNRDGVEAWADVAVTRDKAFAEVLVLRIIHPNRPKAMLGQAGTVLAVLQIDNRVVDWRKLITPFPPDACVYAPTGGVARLGIDVYAPNLENCCRCGDPSFLDEYSISRNGFQVYGPGPCRLEQITPPGSPTMRQVGYKYVPWEERMRMRYDDDFEVHELDFNYDKLDLSLLPSF